ncbi:hypothetical protein RSAG8_07210, partial [Rhizoctonia solani AG-8 WAC10335]
MTSFYGYPCTEENLRWVAHHLHSPYAGYKNAATKLTWELQAKFHDLGPFRLMAAKVDGELGYVFAIGPENCKKESLPKLLLKEMENTFGGGPLLLQRDEEKKMSMYKCLEGVRVELGGVIISNLDLDSLS